MPVENWDLSQLERPKRGALENFGTKVRGFFMETKSMALWLKDG